MMDGTTLGFFDNRLPFYANKASDGSYTGLPAGLYFIFAQQEGEVLWQEKVIVK